MLREVSEEKLGRADLAWTNHNLWLVKSYHDFVVMSRDSKRFHSFLLLCDNPFRWEHWCSKYLHYREKTKWDETLVKRDGDQYKYSVRLSIWLVKYLHGFTDLTSNTCSLRPSRYQTEHDSCDTQFQYDICTYLTWSRGMSRMSEILVLRYWQKQCTNSFV